MPVAVSLGAAVVGAGVLNVEGELGVGMGMMLFLAVNGEPTVSQKSTSQSEGWENLIAHLAVLVLQRLRRENTARAIASEPWIS